MTDHMGQIAEWYEQAERITKTNLPNDGDTIIYPGPVKGSYIVEPNAEGWEPQIVYEDEECRILARAPKPKPAWVNARAIIARTDENPRPSVWTWHKSMDRWDDEGGCHWAYTEDLRDVTPLIEAKVTDEMVERGRDIGVKGRKPDAELVRRVLTAALGLETE